MTGPTLTIAVLGAGIANLFGALPALRARRERGARMFVRVFDCKRLTAEHLASTERYRGVPRDRKAEAMAAQLRALLAAQGISRIGDLIGSFGEE